MRRSFMRQRPGSPPGEAYPDLEAAVHAAQQRIAVHRGAVLPGAALLATVASLVLALVSVWQSSPAALGLAAQFGPSAGQWAVVIFGAIAVVLLGYSRRRAAPALIGSAVAADLIAAVIAASGIDNTWRLTGPGPWLATAGFVFAAALTGMWVRALR
jgi:hypothetical protein